MRHCCTLGSAISGATHLANQHNPRWRSLTHPKVSGNALPTVFDHIWPASSNGANIPRSDKRPKWRGTVQISKSVPATVPSSVFGAVLWRHFIDNIIPRHSSMNLTARSSLGSKVRWYTRNGTGFSPKSSAAAGETMLSNSAAVITSNRILSVLPWGSSYFKRFSRFSSFK